MERLEASELIALRNILAPLFDPGEFQSLLFYRLNKQVRNYASQNDNHPTAIDKVLLEANKEGWWLELLQSARLERPKSQELIDFRRAEKPSGRLSEKQISVLAGILNDLFTLSRFKDFLALRVGQDIEALAKPDDPDLTAVIKVLKAASSAPQPWWGLIVAQARNVFPSDPDLLEFAVNANLGSVIERNQSEGENADINGDIWSERLGEIESCICRVESSGGLFRGTGVLVGPSLVLTSYHVVADFLTGRKATNELSVRFDLKATTDGTLIDPGKIYSVPASDWFVDYTPFDKAHMASSLREEPSDELDYALIRIDGTPGEDPIGGNTRDSRSVRRGWLAPPPHNEGELKSSALYVVQYTVEGMLKVILKTGISISPNASNNRILYELETAAGSSGAPCFDENWNWIAIHQGADPLYFDMDSKPSNGTGTPVGKILEHLRSIGKSHLLMPSDTPLLQYPACEVILLGSPNGDSVKEIASATDELERMLDQAGIPTVRFNDKWAKKAQSPELSHFSALPVKPILIQPIDTSWARAYASSPELLAKDVEIAAGSSSARFKSIVWLPQDSEDNEFASGGDDEASEIMLRTGSVEQLNEEILKLLGRSLSIELPPAFVYQDVQYTNDALRRNNIIRDVIIPGLSSLLVDKYRPPKWEDVPFSDDARAEILIHDIMSYGLGVVAINNFGDDIDQEGTLPIDFRDRLLAIDDLVQRNARLTGVCADNIVCLGIIATTKPKRHPFRYLRKAANEIIARWRFLAVSVESPNEFEIDEGHLNSLYQELEALIKKAGPRANWSSAQ